MANIASHTLSAAQLPDPNDTQVYGSDFDDEELDELNREVERIYAAENDTGEDIEDNPITNDVEYAQEDVWVARVPRSSQRSGSLLIEFDDTSTTAASDGDKTATTNPDISAPLSTIEPSKIASKGPESPETEVLDEIEAKPVDNRPPILRYRAPPGKALSVTDLVSPAWCELQYSFDLSKHGRKRATPAMKKGTVVHERLEAEVYTSVPVRVITKEERWGLRLWNLVSGFEILAETGMTRELEVWGIVGGEVVGGVIDEVSLTCPNPIVAAELEHNGEPKMKKEHKPVKEGQSTLDTFMLHHGATTLAGAMRTQPLSHPFSQSTFQTSLQSSQLSSLSFTPTLYITDVKTRRARSIPNDVSARPTKYQLMLYNRLLSAMIRREFDFATVANHYDLDIHAPFGDLFIAQIASLAADGLDLILSHNSLASLWSLIPGALAKITQRATSTYTEYRQLKVSPLLTAEYRDSSSGDVRGTKTFLYSDAVLDAYISERMEWWHGERPARGVEIEEAFKCQICQFATECEWRKNKVDEAIAKNRGKSKGNDDNMRHTKTQSGFAPVDIVDEMEHLPERSLRGGVRVKERR